MKQYIDFYTQQKEAINANSAPVLNALRDEALHTLSTTPFPKKGSEGYAQTDMEALFAPDYGINVMRYEVSDETLKALRHNAPNMSPWCCFVVNDSFHALDKKSTMPEAVKVMSLRRAAVEYPDIVAKHYGTLAPLSDPQVALNTLLAQDGLFVYIPRGIVLERPLQLMNILTASSPLMVSRRVLVVVEEGAKGELIICDKTASEQTDFLINQVIEVALAPNSHFDLYNVEESSANTHKVESTFARQQDDSNLLVNNITLTNGFSRNGTSIDIVGKNCQTLLNGMAICFNKQTVDNCTYIRHNTPHCQSRELFKYLLDDEATGVFEGKIYVCPGADKVEAYQSNKNIVATDTAKMYTKPQLEIYHDDVKCSHGATIGQLDQNAIFYMRTRGISEHEARTLLMQAFMSDIISEVRLEPLRERLKILVSQQLSQSRGMCGDCATKCTKK